MPDIAEKYQSITEDAIKVMVNEFYVEIRQDKELGPIFQAVIANDWERHLQLMCDFWSSVLLTSRRYYGNPFRAHLMVQNIKPEHFDRWLELFHTTVNSLFIPTIADDIYSRASRMGAAIKQRIIENPFEASQHI